MKKLLTGLVLGLCATVANAADYQFDTAHTQILFTVSHMGFSHSTGQFTEFDGGFTFDESNPEKSSVKVKIKASSVDLSNHAKWIGHVTSADILDAKKYPAITFESTKVTKVGPKKLKIEGDLTIKGETKPVTLDATLNKMGKAFGKDKIGFSATTTIDRTNFGVNYGVPNVGAELEIRIEVEGEKI